MKLQLNPASAVFSAKTFLAAMLALAVALSQGFGNPSWAVVTVYVVAQPMAGAVLSKSLYRLAGTAAGACMAVFLLPPLAQAPVVLSLAVSIWLGVCVFASAIDRTSRAYMFVLAGYSTCIILFPTIAHPEAIFTNAVLRVQEIAVGIICSGLVQAVILPASSTKRLLERLDKALGDAVLWSAQILIEAERPSLDAERRRLAVDINDLNDLLVHSGFESNDLTQRRVLAALLERLERLLSMSIAVDDRLTELTLGEPLAPELAVLLTDVRVWLGPSPDAAATQNSAQALLQHCRNLEPSINNGSTWREALTLSFLARLSDLVIIHRDCRDLRLLVAAPISRSQARSAAVLATGGRRGIDRDYAGAGLAAAATTVTLFLGCMLWLMSGWTDGASAVMLAGVFFSLYSAFGNPALMLKNKFIGVAIRLILGAVYVLFILPAIHDLPMLALSLAPVLLTCGVLLTVPKFSPLAFNLILGVLNPSIISAQFEPDFAQYLNNGLASLTGIYFALTMMSLSQGLWLDDLTGRLQRSTWREIAGGRFRSAPTLGMWRGRMAHRVALLAPRIARDPRGSQPVDETLRDMMTGLSMVKLAQLERLMAPEAKAKSRSLLQTVSDHYGMRSKHGEDAPHLAVLESIDRALAAMVVTPRDTLREMVLAMVSLRRNLFPAQHLEMNASLVDLRHC